MLTNPDYRDGYKQGLDDGYTGRDRLWIFYGRTMDWGNGYSEGYDAGRAHKAYARLHDDARTCDSCGMRGPWHTESDAYPDPATGHVAKRVICDHCSIALLEG